MAAAPTAAKPDTVHRVPCQGACPGSDDYHAAVPALLDLLSIGPELARQTRILLKPNCVNATPHPVTTPPAFVAAMVLALRERTDAEIVIGEGCGDARRETPAIFEALGYTAMARVLGAPLVDLNHAPCRVSRRPDCPTFPELHLPEIALDSFLVSLPVLKAHSLAGITGALKNGMGLLPPSRYAGGGGSWKKAVFHGQMQGSLRDLARHRPPDLSMLDATAGLADYHLGGRRVNPPPGLLLGSRDALALDREACGLLGLDWRKIGHLA